MRTELIFTATLRYLFMFKATKKSATFILFIYQTKSLKWLCTYSTHIHITCRSKYHSKTSITLQYTLYIHAHLQCI